MKIKISNEVKVGVTAILTILAFIYLYNYLKGKDLFSTMASYYVVYDDICGLTESNPVEINGFKAGVVQSIYLINDNTGRLLVELSIKKGYILPEGSVAEITSASLIAGMKIRILFGPGPGIYKNDDTIPGRLSEPILSMFEKEFIPVKNKISNLVNVLDSAITGINEIVTSEFATDIKGSISNLKSTSGIIDEIIGTRKKELKTVIDDLSTFSTMLASSSGKIDKTIDNLKSITDTLSASGLYNTFSELKMTLEVTRELLDGINKGKGTAGQLINNDTLYKNLASSLESLDVLLKDLKENPKKYVHFSLFGRK
ncbi:MAG: MlaD family protein, partial [Bacteroidales bacterium]